MCHRTLRDHSWMVEGPMKPTRRCMTSFRPESHGLLMINDSHADIVTGMYVWGERWRWNESNAREASRLDRRFFKIFSAYPGTFNHQRTIMSFVWMTASIHLSCQRRRFPTIQDISRPEPGKKNGSEFKSPTCNKLHNVGNVLVVDLRRCVYAQVLSLRLTTAGHIVC